MTKKERADNDQIQVYKSSLVLGLMVLPLLLVGANLGMATWGWGASGDVVLLTVGGMFSV